MNVAFFLPLLLCSLHCYGLLLLLYFWVLFYRFSPVCYIRYIYSHTHIIYSVYTNVLSIFPTLFQLGICYHMLSKILATEKRRDELRLAIQLDNIDIVNPLLYKDHCIQISSLAQGGTYLFWFMVLILYIRVHKNTNILLCVQYIQIGLIYCFIYLYVY